MVDDSSQLGQLQRDIVTMRMEMPHLYASLLKKEYKSFVQSLQCGECVLPAAPHILPTPQSEFLNETVTIEDNNKLQNTLDAASNALKCYNMVKNK